MLYEFASGKYPFSADPGLIPREIVHSEPEPLRKLDAQVPEELEQLVARALKKDPATALADRRRVCVGLVPGGAAAPAGGFRRRGRSRLRLAQAPQSHCQQLPLRAHPELAISRQRHLDRLRTCPRQMSTHRSVTAR